MEEDITKKPLVDIVEELTELDQNIDLNNLKIEKAKQEIKKSKTKLKTLIPRYDELRLEIIRRFPTESVKQTFKEKNFTKRK